MTTFSAVAIGYVAVATASALVLVLGTDDRDARDIMRAFVVATILWPVAILTAGFVMAREWTELGQKEREIERYRRWRERRDSPESEDGAPWFGELWFQVALWSVMVGGGVVGILTHQRSLVWWSFIGAGIVVALFALDRRYSNG